MARPKLPEDLVRGKSEVVRVTPEEQAEFTAAAMVLGSNKSAILHVYILDSIQKAKERDREKFDRILASLRGKTSPKPKKPRKR